MNRKIIAILNFLSILFLIAWNGYANTGNYNGKKVGDLSAEYSNLFTPASYAFSIWGLIFLMLFVFGGYGLYRAFNKKPEKHQDFVLLSSPYFLLANIFCSAWVAVWLDEYIGISLLCMIGILVSLLICLHKIKLCTWDAPFPIIFFVWWPLSLYTGWISVAIIANAASFLNYHYSISFENQVIITMVMIGVATVINLLMVSYRNARLFSLVAVWAFVGIYVRHIDKIDTIAYQAAFCAVVLLLFAGNHGYKNRATNPFIKYKQYMLAKVTSIS